MKYAINCSAILGHTPDPGDIIRLAQEAERIGYHSILVGDHVLTPPSFDDSNYPAGLFDSLTPWYDPFILLATMAGATSRIRLGTGIAVVPYRSPVQQAQAISTLDFLSNGRFVYGAGIGWMREEFHALGVPFGERGQRADEYLEVMKLLFSGSGDAYRGKFIDFPGGRLNPLPIQRPGPPIIVGGETPPAMRRIAKYGDGFHINWKTPSEFQRFLDELAPHMANNGKEISSLYKQLAAMDVALVRAQKDRLPDYEALGVDELVFSPKCDTPQQGLDTIQEFADEFFAL
ncbi:MULTISPECIES: LLM class F420-dependent oxidoreductase [Sphingobium]|uniref:LLM class F420-dependent oxidoreductase n=1 Tax=Sphingobium TaxID=165695 RepID=UPI00159BFA92|nr:LLM class F420-dependent oxidoreductase [Sphingobium sp. 15-1]